MDPPRQSRAGAASIIFATGVAIDTEGLFSAIFSGLRQRVGLSGALERPERGSARPGDLRRSCLDVERAAGGLGWRPEVSFQDGIELTLDWRPSQEKDQN